MRFCVFFIVVLLNCCFDLNGQNDSLYIRKHFFNMSVSVGSNFIENQPFDYKTDELSHGSDGTNVDYHIVSLYTVNPSIGLEYSRLLKNTQNYLMFADIESNLFLISEKFNVNGTAKTFYTKSTIEEKVSNYFFGYNTNLNFSLLRKLSVNALGLFIGGGASNTFYFKSYVVGQNLTTKESLNNIGDEVQINITFNVNFGIEYRYRILKHNFCSRLFLSPQITKTHLASFRYFSFNNKNYLTFFSTAIIL